MSLAALLAPVSLFAQSDGTSGAVDPSTVPTMDTPRQNVAETALTPDMATAADSAPPAEQSATAPAPEAVTIVSPAPRPSPKVVQSAPPLQQQPATNSVETAPSTPSPDPVALETVQEFVDSVSEVAPSAFQPWLYAVAGAIAAVIAVLGIQRLLMKSGKKSKKCAHCGGTGHEPVTCVRCEGKGKIEEEYEPAAECSHCSGSGEEPCEECEGRGKKDGSSCDACGGSGTKHDEEEEGFDCSVCGGEGEASITMTREVACPECKGTGKHP